MTTNSPANASCDDDYECLASKSFAAIQSIEPAALRYQQASEYPSKPRQLQGYDLSYDDDDFDPEPLPDVPSRALNVMCVGPSFQIGGVEQHTISLAKFLDPKRVRLKGCLVTNQKGFHAEVAKQLPFDVEPCDPARLTRMADECDVLLMWGEAFNGRLGCKRPIGVFLAHGESRWTRLCLEGSSQVVDHVVAVSSRVKKSVCHGFSATTILNGIDSARLGKTQSRAAMRERLGFEPSDFVLGSVARFTSEKRLHLLIEAVSKLPRPYKLLLVGYGPRRAELLDLANDLIPGRFAITQADDYLGDLYGAMDAFALVSAHEGFGLVIAEAMLCERPVIVTDVGCVPEVICDRINGLVVDGCSSAIATAARSLREHPHWANGLAAEGRCFAEANLHARRMAREFECLLAKVAKARGIQ